MLKWNQKTVGRSVEDEGNEIAKEAGKPIKRGTYTFTPVVSLVPYKT